MADRMADHAWSIDELLRRRLLRPAGVVLPGSAAGDPAVPPIRRQCTNGTDPDSGHLLRQISAAVDVAAGRRAA